MAGLISYETDAANLTGRAANPCPKCGKPLTDAAGLGWCPACGYCRSLEETPQVAKVKVQEAEAQTAPHSMREPPSEPSGPFLIPIWLLCLVVGAIGIAVGSYFIGRNLAPNALPRALWTTCQIGGGVLVLLVGQFLALVRIAPFDEKLSFKDAVLPLRLYGQVIKRLPSMGFSLCTLGWGLTLIASALFFIGGLNHWFVYLKNNKDRPPAVIKSRS